MAIALIVFAAVLAWALLLGTKAFAVFGPVVACAMFHFPLGTIALVAVGVLLLFLLAPRHSVLSGGHHGGFHPPTTSE